MNEHPNVAIVRSVYEAVARDVAEENRFGS